MQISNKVIEQMNTTVEQVTDVLKSIPEPSDQKKLEKNNTILHNVSRTVETIAKEAHEELDEKHDQADQLIEQAKNGMVKSQQKIAAMWKDAHENADHDAIKSIADNMMTSIANPETSETKSDDSKEASKEAIDNGVQILDSIGKICNAFSKTPESKDELYVTEHDGFFKALGKILHIMAMPSDLFPDNSEAGQDTKKLFDLFKKFLVASVEAIVLSSNPILFVPAFVKFAKAAADMYNQAVIAEKSQAKQYTQDKVAAEQRKAKAAIKVPEWKTEKTRHGINFEYDGKTISVAARDLKKLRDIEVDQKGNYHLAGSNIPVQMIVSKDGTVGIASPQCDVTLPISYTKEQYPSIYQTASELYKQEVYSKEAEASKKFLQESFDKGGNVYIYADGKVRPLSQRAFESEPDKFAYPNATVIRSFGDEKFVIEQAGKEESLVTTRSEIAKLAEKGSEVIPRSVLDGIRERFDISLSEAIEKDNKQEMQSEAPERTQEFDRDEQDLGEEH